LNHFTPTGCPTGNTYDKIAKIPGGVSVEDVFQFASSNKITLVAGACPTVGAGGGWLQAGGHGPFSRYYGMGVDSELAYAFVD
jgi:hypothetical protein